MVGWSASTRSAQVCNAISGSKALSQAAPCLLWVQALINAGAAALADEVAVPLLTLERWRLWWTEAFVVTPLWLAGCGAFMPPVDTGALPASLLERVVAADAPTRLIGMLGWLRPLTVRAAVPVAADLGDRAA